jgi:hypothetical protein
MVGGGFCFDVNFMKHVGRNVHGAIQFKGVCFDGGERPDLRVQVPNGGMDILEEPVFWSLPDGRVVCWPLLTLKDKRADELLEENTHEVYRAIAKEFGPSAAWACSNGDDDDERCLAAYHIPSAGYDCCGVAVSEDDLAALRADMGILDEKRWQVLEWDMPADEAHWGFGWGLL